MKNIKKDFNRQEHITWLQQTQGIDGGFGFYPQTTTFIENTYHGLYALEQLEAEPLKLQACEKFILLCRTGNSAFGRKIISIPTLEATYYATKSLEIIDRMKKKHKTF